jgi:hypothetical protein
LCVAEKDEVSIRQLTEMIGKAMGFEGKIIVRIHFLV